MRRRAHHYMRPVPPTVTLEHSSVTATTTSETILDEQTRRYVLVLANVGLAPAWVRMDGGVAVADKTALQILPGERTNPLNYIPGSPVTAITLAGTVDLHVIEGFAYSAAILNAVVDGLGNDIVDGSGNRIVA